MSGGIRQCVRVGAGKRVVLRVPFHVWCSQSDNPQADDGELYVRVGIDSHGRTDPRADDVVWSNWVRGGRFGFCVKATATGHCLRPCHSHHVPVG